MLLNVHDSLPIPPGVTAVSVVRGDYEYWHYRCDGQDDRGWGCGYRTLQTLCSWVRLQQLDKGIDSVAAVPSIPEIQRLLVRIGDKEDGFQGSRDWIGSFEICLVLDTLYDIPSKILHLNSGEDLLSHVSHIRDHFENLGSPVMMGGNIDASSKAIMGVCSRGATDHFFLVVDPHYSGGNSQNSTELVSQNWVKWTKLDDFQNNYSFYNLCLPQLKANK